MYFIPTLCMAFDYGILFHFSMLLYFFVLLSWIFRIISRLLWSVWLSIFTCIRVARPRRNPMLFCFVFYHCNAHLIIISSIIFNYHIIYFISLYHCTSLSDVIWLFYIILILEIYVYSMIFIIDIIINIHVPHAFALPQGNTTKGLRCRRIQVRPLNPSSSQVPFRLPFAAHFLLFFFLQLFKRLVWWPTKVTPRIEGLGPKHRRGFLQLHPKAILPMEVLGFFSPLRPAFPFSIRASLAFNPAGRFISSSSSSFFWHIRGSVGHSAEGGCSRPKATPRKRTVTGFPLFLLSFEGR